MVELLAPAGDMECVKAAVNAGADAIYLGGESYGARAYATNFDTEQLCQAIRYAHLFGVKIYLTVNTLVKQRELDALVPYLKPLYDAHLDGVIVQDVGVLKVIKEHFPGLALHASTQMCVTSSYGANLLKDYGVRRVVPARELSLEEIGTLKQETGMEIECFIHGAMCYAYSGQCLFSSFLGGRSGNRGRCAGPCRLPYVAQLDDGMDAGATDERMATSKSRELGTHGHSKSEKYKSNHASVEAESEYPLSLKDLCTLPMLGGLLDAGVDSLKIEGRMKNPYYVAGVVSIYRKYVDQYLAMKKVESGKRKTDENAAGKTAEETAEKTAEKTTEKTAHRVAITSDEMNARSFSIDPADLQFLHNLYIRSDIETGYYKRHNGPELVTLQKPSYTSETEDVRAYLQSTYLDHPRKLHAACEATFIIGEPMYLRVWSVGEEAEVFVCSEVPMEAATKQPVTREQIKKQLGKTGNTYFVFDEIAVIMEEEVFVSMGTINKVRRDALEQLEELLLARYLKQQNPHPIDAIS